MANGGDNIAVYTALFASRGGFEVATIGIVFAVMTGLWCFAARWLHFSLLKLLVQELKPLRGFLQGDVTWLCLGSERSTASLQAAKRARSEQVLPSSVPRIYDF
jgi:hypothetical protein